MFHHFLVVVVGGGVTQAPHHKFNVILENDFLHKLLHLSLYSYLVALLTSASHLLSCLLPLSDWSLTEDDANLSTVKCLQLAFTFFSDLLCSSEIKINPVHKPSFDLI